ncbi:hypothetical protein WJX81_003936 [Elliptochloris bilobata]|uniref:Uncharacterized protein n=1 Tax=Elliptochloris bilobata TaxID=381761 RepID=A0AAW1RJR0_9CHLO
MSAGRLESGCKHPVCAASCGCSLSESFDARLTAGGATVVTFTFAMPLSQNSCTAGSSLGPLIDQTALLQAEVVLQRGTWV